LRIAELWFLIFDVHAPFHNEKLVNRVLKAIRDAKPYGIILAGDFLDLFTLGKYSENSLRQLRDLTLTMEYTAGRQLLRKFERAIPKAAKKVYMYGNHEDRYFRNMEKGDNAKYGDELASPTEALRLREHRFTVLEDWKEDAYLLGEHLEVIHGLYTNIHTAKNHLDKFQGSVVFGHSHRMQSHLSGKRGAWSVGCLADIKNKAFRYAPRPQRLGWMNGFAEVIVDNRGFHYVTPIQAYNDHFIYRGKVY
jgi:predicted phosphodiesterase